ncbi:HlyD family secretion protein [Chelatococcus sp. GCM10030263]|uniref:HlyD family secretion protein n=1 Tax=Chelatococcus sp. GCM10030263 TaxID=3273387 RepID=UPI0036233ED7
MDRRHDAADGYDLVISDMPQTNKPSAPDATGRVRPAGTAPDAPAPADEEHGPATARAEGPARGKPGEDRQGDAGQAGKTAAGEPAAPAKPKKGGLRKRILMSVAALALIGGAYEGYHWWTVGRFEVETDDAYVHADMTTLAAKVSGYITEIDVTENQLVREGDVIARIDDGDYRLAVQSAQNKIASQDATIARIGEQIKAAEAAVQQAEAQIAAAKADVERTELEFGRQAQLAKSNYASKQALDNARTDRDRSRANLASAQAALASAQANVGVLNAQRVEAQRGLDEDKTDLAKAERDLSFTVVRAPVSGVVGNKAMEIGTLVSVGQRLAALVPLDAVYVDANYKETQLDQLQPGQEVDITVDAYPDRVFKGTVASIAPASGALFSLLPPENATGNFTKIVQRMPVRIQFTADALRDHVLRPGMSVVATVDTRHEPGAATAATASVKP